jgi:opacity protein-like surface antigen
MKIRMYAVAASTLLAFSSSSWAGGSLFGSDSDTDLIAGSTNKSAGTGSFYGGASIGKSSNGACESLADQAQAIAGALVGNVNCESPNAWKVFGGYNLSSNVAVEGSYVNFGEHGFDASIPANALLGNKVENPVTTRAKATGLGVSAVAKAPVMDQLSLFGKAGVMAWKTKGTATIGNVKGTNLTNDVKTDGVDLSLGAGAEYKIDDNWGIRGEYEHVNGLEANMYSVGATFSSF